MPNLALIMNHLVVTLDNFVFRAIHDGLWHCS